jgi:hypothetical protein
VLAWLITASVATAGLAAADSATRYIVDASFGSQQGFADKLTSVVNWSGITTIQPLQAITGASLILVLAIIGIVLVVILWFEMILRNAALAVVIAVSPIAAAGQAGGEATRAWWTRTVSAAAQLIILKVVIALVFAVGFGMAGTSTGIAALLHGLLVLLLGVFAWPVVARFFTFASVQAASAGLAGVLGFAAGMTAGRAGGGHGVAGVDPGQFSRSSETRVMGAAGGSAGGGEGGGGSGGALLGGIGFALRKAHQGGTLLAGRFEQTAGHAGMSGAYPYSTIGGGQGISPRRAGGRAGQAPPRPGGGDGHRGEGPPGTRPAGSAAPPLPAWAGDEADLDDEFGEPDD